MNLGAVIIVMRYLLVAEDKSAKIPINISDEIVVGKSSLKKSSSKSVKPKVKRKISKSIPPTFKKHKQSAKSLVK